MMIIVDTEDDGARGSMIRASQSSFLQPGWLSRNCWEAELHRAIQTQTLIYSHRHAETQTHRQRAVWGQRHIFIHRQTKPQRDTQTETQFTIHHWFDRSVGHSHFNLSQTRLNVEIISDLLSLKIKIRSDCVYLHPHSQRSHSLENGGINNKCI